MDGFVVYYSEMLSGICGLVHAFGCRGLDTKSSRAIPEELRFLGIPPDGIFTLRQVHSSHVLVIREEDLEKRGTIEGDGAVCVSPGMGMAILTADCLPVIVASESCPGFLMIHGGWRGLHSGIVESGLTLFRKVTGAHPDSLKAAIGPAASPCCYEVGWDVARLFNTGYPESLEKSKPNRFLLDLKRICGKKLVLSGLLEHNIDIMNECTVCDVRFHSVRRNSGIKLRQISVAYLS
jgi:YfiH family protein